MKNMLKAIVSFLFLLCIKRKIISIGSNILFLTTLKGSVSTKISLFNSIINRSKVIVNGKNNELKLSGCLSNISISISGNNNLVEFSEDVKLSFISIIIKGDNCRLFLGNKVTFEGGRIVLMGENNFISIGEGCMLSDSIELWATDSHPIYDENNKLINYSRPITIGKNVWLGAHVCVLKGSVIKDNSVVGMGSLVSGVLDGNSVYAGNPVKLLKQNIHWDRAFILK